MCRAWLSSVRIVPMNKLISSNVLGMLLVLAAPQALAYIGPGSGLGAFGIFLGAVGALALAVVGFFWYPLKRWYTGIRQSSEDSELSADEADSADTGKS